MRRLVSCHMAGSQFGKTTFDNTSGNIDISCNHAFGHSKDVHFAWYKKRKSNVDLTKMVKLLVVVDKGKKVKKQKIEDVLNTSEASNISDTEHEHSDAA